MQSYSYTFLISAVYLHFYNLLASFIHIYISRITLALAHSSLHLFIYTIIPSFLACPSTYTYPFNDYLNSI